MEDTAVSPKLNQEQQALVLCSRDRGMRMAIAISRQWGARINPEDLQSIVDIALCEAAVRFDTKVGADFLTYGWYFIQGGVRKYITSNVAFPPLLSEIEQTPPSDEGLERCAHDDREAYQHLSSTLKALPSLHRKVFVEVSVLGHKVAAVARNLGYSRPHLSEVHQKALRRVRTAMKDFRSAA